MATVVNKNSIVFEMPYLRENSLTKTFWNIVQTTLKKEHIGAVVELLQTCDHFNSGIYENTYPKEVTKVTLTYYTKSGKVKVSIEYGEYGKGEKLILGMVDGNLLENIAVGYVKEKIAYFGTQTDRLSKKFTGYSMNFTLQLTNK